jgi:Intracellular proteinase inhibitor
MKNLFVIALAALAVGGCSAPEAEKPNNQTTLAPAATDARKPGFWERAWESTRTGSGKMWDSTKNAGSRAADVVKSPFSGKKKGADQKAGWRQLAVGITLDPLQVKLPATRSLLVKVAVTNKGKYAAQLDFPTTQRIEVLVKSDTGKVLSRWSEDQKVEREQGFVVLNPDERLEYSAMISTREMRAGQSYVIEAYLPDFDRLRASRTVSPVN